MLESVHELGVGAERRSVDTEAIEQSFASAGWEIDGGFSEYLIIGYNGDGLSILAHPQAGNLRILSSNSSITRGTSPMGSRKYRPPSRQHRFSKSTASPPRSLTTTRSRRRLRRARKLGATYFYLLV